MQELTLLTRVFIRRYIPGYDPEHDPHFIVHDDGLDIDGYYPAQPFARPSSPDLVAYHNNY